jgi:phage terminase small subunit
MAMSKLTEKQKKFCREYVKTLNATQSAIKAGYPENSAGEMGYENLKKPQIKEYIQSILDKQKVKDYQDTELILNEILSIAMGSCIDELKASDRLKALELLSRYNNLFEKEKKSEAPKIEIRYVGD